MRVLYVECLLTFFSVPLLTPDLHCIENFKIISLWICWLNKCILCCILYMFWCCSIFSVCFINVPISIFQKFIQIHLLLTIPFYVVGLGLCLFKNFCFSLLLCFYGLGWISVSHLEVCKEEQDCPTYIKTFWRLNDTTYVKYLIHILNTSPTFP